jgi:hypothetical protein
MLGVSPWQKAPVAPSPANCCSGTGHAIVDKVLAQEAVQRNVALPRRQRRGLLACWHGYCM